MNMEMTSRTCKILSASCLAVLFSAMLSTGATITVVNGDFSSPVLGPDGLSNGIEGWNREDIDLINFGGTANVGSGFAQSYPGIALGDQIGYSVWNAGITGTVIYTQQLSATLENNTLYTIGVGVAQSVVFPLPLFTDGYSDDPGVNDIVIRLLAGGQVFGTFSSSVSVVAGSLSPWTISQQSSANEALFGQQLTLEIFIRKGDSASTVQFAMDNISVTADAIPEAGTTGMLIAALGLGLIMKLRRKSVSTGSSLN